MDITDLTNIVSILSPIGIRYIVGEKDDALYLERFERETGTNIPFDDGYPAGGPDEDKDRKQITVLGNWPGVALLDEDIVVDSVNGGTFISYDGGENWEEV